MAHQEHEAKSVKDLDGARDLRAAGSVTGATSPILPRQQLKYQPIAIEQTSQVQSVPMRVGPAMRCPTRHPRWAIARRRRFKSPMRMSSSLVNASPMWRAGSRGRRPLERHHSLDAFRAREGGVTRHHQKNVDESRIGLPVFCSPSSARRDIGEKMCLAR